MERNTSKKRWGFALVGTGVIAPYHLKALSSIDECRVVTVCDTDSHKARSFAEEHGLAWTDNLQTILDDPQVDVVDVTVPSGLHAGIGIAAALAGKHVMVEKPIDISLDKADRLIRTCRDTGVILGVISQNRFLDSMQTLYRTVESGALGTLLQGDAAIKWHRTQAYYDSGAWRGTRELDGGGAFMNQGIHFIDLLLSIMGPVKWLQARCKTAAHRIEVEDIGMVLLEFESGAYGVIQASTAFFPGLPARLEIHGTRGSARIEGERLAFLHVEGEDSRQDPGGAAGGASDPKAIEATPFEKQYRDFIAAIEEKRDPIVSGTVARKPLQLILAIYESSRLQKPVELAKFS
ncbi:Gfo/Idh/MocA family oxidoreductase [candidate division KSB1 bacterium]|nr:Gfo/Idh/MocA family oxidoreductase [candidate division KSB1 bacterium]